MLSLGAWSLTQDAPWTGGQAIVGHIKQHEYKQLVIQGQQLAEMHVTGLWEETQQTWGEHTHCWENMRTRMAEVGFSTDSTTLNIMTNFVMQNVMLFTLKQFYCILNEIHIQSHAKCQIFHLLIMYDLTVDLICFRRKFHFSNIIL